MEYTVTYWENKPENVICKRISDTVLIQVQIKGTDLREHFIHSHVKSEYPSKERLDEHLSKFQPSSEEQYNTWLSVLFQITRKKEKAYQAKDSTFTDPEEARAKAAGYTSGYQACQVQLIANVRDFMKARNIEVTDKELREIVGL